MRMGNNGRCMVKTVAVSLNLCIMCHEIVWYISYVSVIFTSPTWRSSTQRCDVTYYTLVTKALRVSGAEYRGPPVWYGSAGLTSARMVLKSLGSMAWDSSPPPLRIFVKIPKTRPGNHPEIPILPLHSQPDFRPRPRQTPHLLHGRTGQIRGIPFSPPTQRPSLTFSGHRLFLSSDRIPVFINQSR